MKKCLFLDRDGTINKNYGYVCDYKNFTWLKNSKKAIQLAYKKNYLIIIISNQSGVSRGYYSINDCNILNNQINNELKKYNCKIHDFFYAYYHPKFKKKFNYFDRKPNPGMIYKAQKKWNIDLKKSIYIGDKKCDEDLAIKLKLKFKLKKNNLLKEVKSLIF